MSIEEDIAYIKLTVCQILHLLGEQKKPIDRINKEKAIKDSLQEPTQKQSASVQSVSDDTKNPSQLGC